MKIKKWMAIFLVLTLLITCLLLTACQASVPTEPNTSGGSLETPTAGTTAPTTLPTQTTVLPTTLPTPPATEPPQINNTVTPALTEPFDLHSMEKFVILEVRSRGQVMELALDVEIGQTVVDSHFAYLLERYDNDTYIGTTICFSAMLTGDEQEDAALCEQIMQRFKDAGYYTESEFSEYAQFSIIATKEQILEMFCGDDLAVYICSTIYMS